MAKVYETFWIQGCFWLPTKEHAKTCISASKFLKTLNPEKPCNPLQAVPFGLQPGAVASLAYSFGASEVGAGWRLNFVGLGLTGFWCTGLGLGLRLAFNNVQSYGSLLGGCSETS